MADGTKHSAQSPVHAIIFPDQDVPCPQCGYNLRGLAEPRCPECGADFEPTRLIETLRRAPAKPPFWWIVGRMLRDPVAAWSTPRFGTGWAPGLGQAALTAIVSVGLALIASIFAAVVRGSVSRSSWGVVAGFLLLLWLAGASIAFILLLVHERLCRRQLPSDNAPVPARRSRLVTLCAAAWLMVALPPGFTGWETAHYLFGMRVYRRFIPFSPAKETALTVLAGVCLAGMAAACSLWIVSLWKGARVAGGASARQAAWCVLTNPFLYLFAWGAVETAVRVLVR